ncbi:peptide/nickel transport system permease protein [Neorhizobium sp. 2083]|uniref:ABC transporter permease n=1 Tax=Neorhizobium sp. 2083 TaxID=2817762 RepID=UPI0028572B5C|nr:ABC transporter permease [Neorhizobium sp. 2083]MDR6821111.1 peptide/nickel transport system permease protein [Neorhizobium sp. 2083]
MGPANRKPYLVVGLVLATTLGIVAAVGDRDPLHQDLMLALTPPSLRFPLGTDHLGRDVFARLIHALPRSIGIAMTSMVVAASVGTIIGLTAAASNRLIDAALMRLTDLALAFPGLLLAMVLAGLLGGGAVPVLVGISLAQWPQFARITQSIAATVLTEPHIESSRIAGLAEWRILLRQVMPRILPQTTALATLSLGGAVLTISSLGFLGLGLQPPTPEWGAMITELLPYMDAAPFQIAAPCVALFLTVLSCMAAGQRLAEVR